MYRNIPMSLAHFVVSSDIPPHDLGFAHHFANLLPSTRDRHVASTRRVLYDAIAATSSPEHRRRITPEPTIPIAPEIGQRTYRPRKVTGARNRYLPR